MSLSVPSQNHSTLLNDDTVSWIRTSRSTGWLISPAYDLFLIANCAWPLLLLWQWQDGFAGRSGLQFWQVYFVTTPHRWITLGLVLLDRERLKESGSLFAGIAIAVLAICLGIRLGTGTLTCLLTIDYLWNAWHFAAQHQGIYQIYRREAARQNSRPVQQVSGTRASLGEQTAKWAFRGFWLYVALRVAGVTWANEPWEATLQTLDGCALIIPVSLLGGAMLTRHKASWGQLAYLASVMILASSLLAAVHLRKPAWVVSLATASALFHATEYLAIVGWSVKRRAAARGERLGALAWLAPRWGFTVILFMGMLGSAGWLMDQNLLEIWLFLNVVAAFLHYAYDGIIWRKPRKAIT